MDIVARLRAQRDFADDWRTTLAEEAADNIEKLRGDVAAYRKDFRSIAEALNDPRCDLTHTMAELIAELRAELALAIDDCRAAQVERDNVRAAYITQIDRLRAELAECQLISARQFLDYGWHKDGCAFREDCDPCDCGFETLLRAALTANKQARKGEDT